MLLRNGCGRDSWTTTTTKRWRVLHKGRRCCCRQSQQHEKEPHHNHHGYFLSLALSLSCLHELDFCDKGSTRERERERKNIGTCLPFGVKKNSCRQAPKKKTQRLSPKRITDKKPREGPHRAHARAQHSPNQDDPPNRGLLRTQ